MCAGGGGGGGGADESISNARKRNTLSFIVLSSKYQSDLVMFPGENRICIRKHKGRIRQQHLAKLCY